LYTFNTIGTFDESKQKSSTNAAQRALLFFPSDCRLPKTIFMLFKLTDNDDHAKVY